MKANRSQNSTGGGKAIPSRTQLVTAAIGAAVFGGIAVPSEAAIYTWSGATDATWAISTNWSPNSVPATGDTATLSSDAATVNNNTNVSLGTGVTVNTVLFDTANAATYAVGTSGQALTLDNGGAVTVNAAVVNAQAINANVTFAGGAGSFSFTNNSAATLTFGGTVTSAASTTQTLTVAGSGNTALNGTLNDGASATLNLTKTGAGSLRVGGPATDINGTLDIQGGTVGTTNDFSATGLTGTGILENGTAADKWSFWNIASGTNTFDGTFRNGAGTGLLGLVKRGGGTMILTNNANNQSSNLSVDAGKLVLNGTGTYGAGNQGGAARTNLTCLIGNAANLNGILEVNGATVNWNNRNNADAAFFRSTLTVGQLTNSAGDLRLTSGSISLNRQLALGNTGAAYGGYNQTGGTATVAGFLALGLGTSTGVFNQSAGTYTNSAGPITNGAGANGNGLINLSGTAAFNVNGTGDNGLWVGENGNGKLNVAGSATLTFASANNGLQLGRGTTGTAFVNLNGGVVTTPKVYRGTGTGVLSFNGGTLKANLANTAFLTGLTATYIYSGGATIDDGGNVITVGQALLDPSVGGTAQGISSTGLTVSGGGYIDTPLVTVTGGGGTTAIATIDSSGNLTGIVMTSPGTGYTSAPTFALVGGGMGNTGAIGGTASLTSIPSGGLTKTNSGTLFLNGVNTYTGTTNLNQGTLGGTGSLASPIVSLLGTTLAPGASIGTLTDSNSVTLNGDLAIELNATVADLLAVGGSLNLSSGTDSVTFSTLATPTATSYTIATYVGTLTGTFNTVNNLPAGYALNYGTGSNSAITLQVVPEPVTLGCLVGTGLLVSLRRHRS